MCPLIVLTRNGQGDHHTTIGHRSVSKTLGQLRLIAAHKTHEPIRICTQHWELVWLALFDYLALNPSESPTDWLFMCHTKNNGKNCFNPKDAHLQQYRSPNGVYHPTPYVLPISIYPQRSTTNSTKQLVASNLPCWESNTFRNGKAWTLLWIDP